MKNNKLKVYCAPEMEAVECEIASFLCESPVTTGGGLNDLGIIDETWGD